MIIDEFMDAMRMLVEESMGIQPSQVNFLIQEAMDNKRYQELDGRLFRKGKEVRTYREVRLAIDEVSAEICNVYSQIELDTSRKIDMLVSRFQRLEAAVAKLPRG
jgi:hypothetical protein